MLSRVGDGGEKGASCRGGLAGGLFQAVDEGFFQGGSLVALADFFGTALCQYPAGVHQRDAVAALCLVHEVVEMKMVTLS